MDDILNLTINLVYLGILIGFVLSLVRLILGPTLADRVVALDLIAFLTISFVGVYALETGKKAFLDIAITLALVAFLSTVAFAHFISKRNESKKIK